MDLKRFFCDNITDNYAYLYGDEFYHATKVTRHKIGYKLIVCDNGIWDYYCTIEEIGKDFLKALIDKKVPNACENAYKLRLFVGNNKKIDSVVQQAVECGVNEIIPFLSQHCNEPTIHHDRLQKIIVESSKQCGRSKLARLKPMIDFQTLIEDTKTGKTFAFYELDRSNRVIEETIAADTINIIIGCEGGFSEEEIALFRSNGIKTYSLGNRILRVPTAVVAACSVINEKMDNLK